MVDFEAELTEKIGSFFEATEDEAEALSKILCPWNVAVEGIESVRQKSRANTLKDSEILESTKRFRISQWGIVSAAAEMTVRYQRKKMGNLLADTLADSKSGSYGEQLVDMSKFVRSTYDLSNKTLRRVIQFAPEAFRKAT